MPLTPEQIIASQSGLASAIANNPKNTTGHTMGGVNQTATETLEGGGTIFYINPPKDSDTVVSNPLPPRPEPTPTPTSGGTSVVAEPNLGTPTGGTVSAEVLTDSGTSTDTPTNTPTENPIKNLVSNLPTFLGGGGGGGGATTDSGAVVPATKPNYVLYIGILLAVIVAYKVLSKKES